MKQKFNELSRREQICRIAVVCLNLAMFFTALGFLIYVIRIGDPQNRLATCFGMMAVSLAPLLLEAVFRFRFSFFAFLFLDFFILLAGFTGSMFSVYGRISNFDKYVHSFFGYFGCVAGLWMLCRSKKFDDFPAALVAVFCFAVSMASGAIWEIIEFTGDNFFGQTAQGTPDALGNIGVWDTMTDIICNFGGAIVFVLHYILYRVTRRNLLMGSIIADFKR